eukprot:4316647-Pyramimonas_sp.AAC.1
MVEAAVYCGFLPCQRQIEDQIDPVAPVEVLPPQAAFFYWCVGPWGPGAVAQATSVLMREHRGVGAILPRPRWLGWALAAP